MIANSVNEYTTNENNPQQSPEECDKLAREAILTLKNGKYPADIIDGPDFDFSMDGKFGIWGETVRQVEKIWSHCPSNDKRKVAELIDILCKNELGNSQLAALLEEDDTVQGEDESSQSSNTDDAPPLNYELPAFDTSESVFAYTRDEFCKFSAILSPEGYEWFHLAAFYATCSSIAMRRLAIDFSDPMYTNLYIVLCAKSSVWKKSTSRRAIERIMKSLSLQHTLHNGEETPQFFIEQASGGIPRNYEDLDAIQRAEVNNSLATAGLETLFFDELGQYLLGTRKTPDNTLWRRIILEWKECPDNWRKGTKGTGWEIVPTTYLSIFGCMVPDTFNEKEMQSIIKDGTMPRFMIIAPPNGTSSETHSFEMGYVPTPPQLVKLFMDWHKRLIIPKVEITPETETNDKGKETTTYAKNWIQPLITTNVGMTKDAHKYWHNYRVASKECIVSNNISSSIAAYYDRPSTDFIQIAAIAASFEGKDQIDVIHLAMVYPFIEMARQGIHRFISQSGMQMSKSSSYEEKLVSTEKEVMEEIKEYLSPGKSGKKDFSIPILLNKRIKLRKIPLSRLTSTIENFVQAGLLSKEIHTHPVNKTKTIKYRLS
jgi:hypothetical protein